MKKLSLVAIATVLAAPAFAQQVAVPVSVNTSASNGVNVGSVTNLGLNNVGVVNQNVGLGGGVVLAPNAFNQSQADFNMDTHAFSVGSIVDSGNGGNGGDVNVVAVSAAVALSGNEADQGGLAGGLAVPVALASQGGALQDATTNLIPVNVGVGVGDNSAASGARVNSVQANLSSQRSLGIAGSNQQGIGNGIDANGGDGQAFMITVNSNNTHIDNTSVSKIAVATNVNIADRGGVADGLRVDDSFKSTDVNLSNVDVTTVEDSYNALTLDGDAVAASGNRLGIFGF